MPSETELLKENLKQKTANIRKNGMFDIKVDHTLLDSGDDDNFIRFYREHFAYIEDLQYQLNLLKREAEAQYEHGVIHLTKEQVDKFNQEYSVHRNEYNTLYTNEYPSSVKYHISDNNAEFEYETGAEEPSFNDSYTFITYTLIDELNENNTDPVNELTTTELAAFINKFY